MFIFLLLQILHADLVLTSEVTVNDEKIKSITYLSDRDFLVESPTRQSALLYNGKDDQFYIIDHKDKKITMMYQKDLFVHARKRAKLAPNTDEIKKNLPNLYNHELESALDDILKASDMSYQKMSMQVKAEDNSKKWKNLATQKYDAIVDGKKTLSLWVVPATNFKLTTNEMQSITTSAKLLRFFIASLGQETSSTVEVAYLKVLEKNKSVLVMTEQYGPNFKVEASSRLIDFKRGKSFASKFKAPTTYTQTNFVPK